jgi:shikimate dehydrogenase
VVQNIAKGYHDGSTTASRKCLAEQEQHVMNGSDDEELGRGDASWVPTIGHPAGQIKWSLILNGIFRRRAINAVASALELPPDSLGGFLDIVRASPSIKGFSATIPHKIPLVALVDRLSARAARAHAVNVVIKDTATGQLTGDIIDGLGFMKSLAFNEVAVERRRLLLFGAGGVSRAIVASLLDHPVGSIHVADLSPARAAELAGLDSGRIEPIDLAGARAAVGRFDIIINATPLGMKAADPLPFDPGQCRRDACILDVVNRNGGTALSHRALALGLRYIGGGGMLEFQIDTFLELLGLAGTARS